MNILSIIIGVIILGFALKGLKNGLILTICSFLIVFIAVAVTQILTPQVTSMIRSNDSLVTTISEKVKDVIFSDEDDEMENGNQVDVVDSNDEGIIKDLGIPKVMKDQLLKNNNEDTYESLGVTSLQDYISLYIGYSLINCVTYIIVFLVVTALLKVIAHVLNLVSKLPVINTLNKFGGFAVGLAEGAIVTWLLFIVFVVISNTSLGVAIYKQIEESVWLSYLYNNNLLFKALSSIMKGLI